MALVGRTSAHRRGECGWAYLWTLLFALSLSVAATSAARTYASALKHYKEQELRSIGRQFRAALASYERHGPSGQPPMQPARLEELLEDRRAGGEPRRHLRKVFVDPFTGQAQWALVRRDGRIIGVHSLSQQTPAMRHGFEPDEGGFERAMTYQDWIFANEPPPRRQ